MAAKKVSSFRVDEKTINDLDRLVGFYQMVMESKMVGMDIECPKLSRGSIIEKLVEEKIRELEKEDYQF